MARFPTLIYNRVSVIDIGSHAVSHIFTSIPVLRELLHDASTPPPRMLMRTNSKVFVPYICSECSYCENDICNETALSGRFMICSKIVV